MSSSNSSNQRLTGKTVQSDCFRAVTRTGSCSANEWACDGTNSTVMCSQVDASVCPPMANYTLSARFISQSTTQPEASALVECTYTPNNSNATDYSTNQVQQFKNAFGTNESWREIIMPEYCSLPGKPSNCNINPETGKPFTSCSRFTTTDQSGLLCRDYVKVEPTASAAVQEGFCKTNQTPDCICINRDMNSAYIHIKKDITDEKSLGNIPDVAWYAPCRDPTRYVVTAATANMANAATIPPCSEFNNVAAVRSGKINAQTFDATVDCVGNKDPDENPVQGASGSGKLLDEFAYVILFILGAIIVLIIVGLIVRVTQRRRDNIRAAHILAAR